MAKLTDNIKNEIIANWKAGWTQGKLAKEYELSKATINKLCKGVEQSNIDLVNAQVAIKSELAEKSEQEVNAVHQMVDEKTKHLNFFKNATLKNASVMMQKVNEDLSMNDHKQVQETLDKGLISMGLADRHAPKGDVNVQTNNQTVVQKITRTIIDV